MSNTIVCPTCKGEGSIEVFINEHDYEKDTVECKKCYGSGKIHTMTDEEERDYWADYW